MHIRAITTSLTYLSIFVVFSVASTYAAGPEFTSDVVVTSSNPDFILDTTEANDFDWAIEIDEPEDDNFSIAWGTWSASPVFTTNPFVIEKGAPTNLLYLDSSHKVGINSPNPSAALEIREFSTNATDIRLVTERDNGSEYNWNLTNCEESCSEDFTGFNIGYSGPEGSGTPFHVATGAPSGSIRITSAGVAINGATVTLFSSRKVKTEVLGVNSKQILDKVVSLPVSYWEYKHSKETTHLGPMAEDFYKIFDLGDDPSGISVVDISGVALAAIQGLKAEKDAEIAELKTTLTEYRTELDELKATIRAIAGSNQVALMH